MITPNIFDDIDTVMKCPSLLDAASKSTKYEVLVRDPTMIKNMKKPRLEYQQMVILNDINNIKYINHPDKSIIQYVLSIDNNIIECNDETINDIINTTINIGINNKLSKFKLLKLFIKSLFRYKKKTEELDNEKE